MKNSMKLEFLSISENEKFARTAVAAFVSQLNPTLDEIEDIKAAVSEAVTNSVIHGYKNTTGTVYVDCSYNDTDVKITISDNGRGIEDVELAMTPLYTGTQDEERSGLGFTVMETFMDEITVKSNLNEGTSVTMTKRIRTSSPSSL